MSYILDALRKADAQRERDASRGIHAQATPRGTGASDAAAPRLATWGALGGAVAIIGAAAWYFARPVAAPATAEPPPLQASPSHAAPTSMAPSPANAIAPPPEPVTRPAAPAPASREAPAPPMRGALAPRAAPPPPAAMAATATPAPVATPAASAPVIAGLPPDAPRLAISGGVYSPSPTQRMLIVNGQVFNEGSEVAAGVTLEKIEARTAILRFRGARYTVAY